MCIKYKFLAPEQAGLIECYIIVDQVTYLSQTDEDAFQKKKVLVLWVDFEKGIW